MVRVAVLTVSDRSAVGEREDRSGAILEEWARQRGYDVCGRAVVSDDTVAIAGQLCRWADGGGVDVILTTGGTGLTARDVTPEATTAVLDRDAPGIAEALRSDARERVPTSVLSRGIAGVRGRTLIVNLPGSPGGARDGAAALGPILDHAVALLRGEPSGHDG